MKPATVVLLILLFSASCFRLAAEENPFRRMSLSTYAAYSGELNERWLAFNAADSLTEREVLSQLREVAGQTQSPFWQQEYTYFQITLQMRRLDEHRPADTTYPELLQRLLRLSEEALRQQVVPVLLQTEDLIITCYWLYAVDYEEAFEHCTTLAKYLEDVSSADIPEKTYYYRRIADCHYQFADYETASAFYQQILAEQETVRNQETFLSARNGLGLCYRDLGDLNRSDSCFHAILQTRFLLPEHESARYVWDGIAEGNIAENLLLRGQDDEAIPWLESSREKVLRQTQWPDYAFAAGPAVHLAEVWLRKGDLKKARQYIDLATDYNRRMPRAGRQGVIYEVTGKYYAATGDVARSAVYLDSALIAARQYNTEFSALQLMRAQQRVDRYEQQLKEEELRAEKVRSATYLRYITTVSTAMLLILALLVILFGIYRKKQTAYRALVRQNQRWAAVGTVVSEPVDPICASEKAAESNGHPDEADFALMRVIEHLMGGERIYTDATLSVETLTHRLGVKRYYVSNAINRCTGKSFNTFVNEYRVKEAIRLLSEHDADAFSIDGIAFDAGFNDRRNFYRVFKKMTGLSPTEFRKNAVKEY